MPSIESPLGFSSHPELHSVHEPLPYPDYDSTGQERPITPPGVDLDFDPETDPSYILAWEALVAQLRSERLEK